MAFDLGTLARRLDALVVFRALLHDDVLSSLRTYLGDGQVASYAEFVYRLVQSGSPSLAQHVCELTCDDENAYVRASLAGDVPPELGRMLACELETLQGVADLTARDLTDVLDADARDDFLPGFEAGKADVASAYRERIAAAGQRGFGVYAHHRMFYLSEGGAIVPVRHPDPIRLSDLVDYEREHEIVLENTRALLAGKPAANVLLTGDAGTGKSSTVKAIVNELWQRGLRVIELRKDQLHLMPAILDELAANPLRFILFVDDLSFQGNDDNYAALKAVLEGSVSARSANVVIYATSNRRHIVRETFSEREGDEVHLNDTLQEQLSLSERFGIHVSFSRPSKDVYLDIVRKLADEAGISCDAGQLDAAAERYALRRGGRSARGARQFVDALLAGSQVVS